MKLQSPTANLFFRGPMVLRYPDEAAPEAAPVAAPETPSSAPEDGGIFGDANLNAIFEFDPFEAPAASTESAPVSADPPPEGEAAPTGADSLTSAQPVPAPKEMDKLVESLKTVADKLSTPNGEQLTPAADADPIDGRFSDIQLPDNLLAAVRSENPAESAMALNIIVQGTARMAVRHAKQLMDSFVTESLPQILGSYTRAQETAKSVHDDFYGTYPERNKAEIKPFVTQIASMMATEMGDKFKGGNAEFRDAVAQRLMAIASVAAPKPAEPQPAPSSFTPSGVEIGRAHV